MAESKSLRVAYGEALAELGAKNDKIVVMDADLAHATMTNMFQAKFPDRHFNFGIAEANMVCGAAGFATEGYVPFVSTFALFGAGRAYEPVSYTHLMPAIFSSFLICLTYSIDDFIISYFTSGTVQTLPITIYSMTKKRVSPEINGLSAIMFVVILGIILLSNTADSAKERRLERIMREEERKAGMA